MPSDIIWTPKNEYPTLIGNAKRISFDVETKDPHLEDKGPGAFRKDGYIVGFSVATDDGFKAYYPIRHPEGNVENPKAAISWLKDQLKDNTPKVGANILYDLIWLKCDLGIDVGGVKYDVQVAEPLINENQFEFNLDHLAEKWLGLNKEEDLLYEAGVKLLGLKPKKGTKDARKSVIKQVKAHLWRLPSKDVGLYGEADADLPLKVFDLQYKKLEEDQLIKVFDIETELLEVLFQMYLKGVRVDTSKAEEVADMLDQELGIAMRKIKHRTGLNIDIWSGESLATACQTLGLQYNKTEKGNPSFEADWLLSQDHEFFKLVAEARSLDRSGSVFVRKNLIELAVNGRIHPEFKQVKSDRGGTVAGRLASSNPNAQQFPARNERIATLVRSCVIPEDGCELAVFDYKQQEPRVTVHYAYLAGLPMAAEARQKFIDDPKTDYHQMTADMANIERKPAKEINLGLTYGMGEKKLAAQLGLNLKEAKRLFLQYHNALPYISKLSKKASNLANQRGFIRTILGRRRHFNMWGPPTFVKGKTVLKEYDEALKMYGPPIIRYFTYKALNGLVQGSSADMIKVALVLSYRAGYIPHMSIHDENDYSIKNRKEAKEIKEIMIHETAEYLGMTVPLATDVEIGSDWGHCELDIELSK